MTGCHGLCAVAVPLNTQGAEAMCTTSAHQHQPDQRPGLHVLRQRADRHDVVKPSN